MATDRFAPRRSKLIRAVRAAGVDAILVSNFTNVTYLTGFSGDDSYLLVGKDQTVLISDTRYAVQIQEECPGLDTHVRTNRQPLNEAVAKVVKRAKLQKLGFESNSTSVESWRQLEETLKSLELVPLSGLTEELRAIKDRHEIAETREAVKQAEQGFAVLRASLLDSMTEREVAFDLEHAMRRFGANAAAFDPIVAAGPRAALPHAHPTNELIGSSDFVLIDWGASNAGGYKSDLTRVLATGKISPKLEKIYRVVLNAQLRAIRAIRPGARCGDIDSAARRVIEKAGFGRNFGHGLGHGVGLDIHENPRLSPGSKTILKAGMVVTVEPGIYLPGWGGVRIEDDVLVTRDGHEVLTSVPKELDEIAVE